MKIDVVFPITKPRMVIPLDHGYQLFSAISRHLPELHGGRDIFMNRFNGALSLRRNLAVNHGHLRFRVNVDMFSHIKQSLVGKRLRVSDQSFQMKSPYVQMIEPATDLFIPFLVIHFTKKDMNLRDAYRREIKHQLDKLGVASASFELLGSCTLGIKGQTLIGFNVVVRGLSNEESLTLQYQGLGGKHSMGCGIPRPDRGARKRKAA